ncbi:glyceraldehyde-3-phosphate dehydrogenase (NADP+) [Mycoplasmoides fastidiosum]|uniref:Glyceraldehyde-3-phosphate dehydrogenase (NADP+) n=1 Tax=Mycoplasmoides fastidiosum TaxID=92758 RepID=A0ABU0LYP6_9BACT|nr:aldehyde dehydrogenase family protein [Mycoplasmoides fastidiosum]MDQ0513804.1 glyceraldehyde-3-phosphate dehydrogenase (NADP+) [Mycoplasmoides fastidiosum]UUD37778.1 aldehyde dehydrogenase family protein [Mycoplasmoides fastidiosum]
MKNYLAYINGKFVDSANKVQIYSPETSQVIGTYPALNKSQIDDAYDAASVAFEVWSHYSHQKRAQYLLAFAAELKNHVEQIADLMSEEIAKNLNESKIEILRTVDYITETVHTYLELIENPEVYSHSTDLTMPKDKVAVYHRKPFGVALTISPFNYPVNLMLAKVAPALITGNTVVHKSATQGSLVGAYVAQLFDNIEVAGEKLLPGVFNYVTGRGSEIGDYLVQHPKVAIASFTGGTDVGIRLASHMAMRPYVLELGGKDAALVLDDADIEKTANEIVKGSFSYSGQRCTAIKRVFVSDKKAPELIPVLVEKVNALTVGSAKNNCQITHLVEKKSVDVAKRLYQDALDKGAKNLTNEMKIEGNLVTPVLLDLVTPAMDVAWVEPFAPIIPILRYQNIDEAIKLINQSEYGLQGSIFTEDYHQAVELGKKFQTGTVNINRASSRGPDVLPFLGIKNSGFGIQGIGEALKFYTRTQGLVLNDEEIINKFDVEDATTEE